MRLKEIALVLIGIGVAVLCNWTYLMTDIFVETRTGQLLDYALNPNEVLHYVAGWPLKYYVRAEYPGGFQITDFSIGRLSINVVTWCGFLGALFLYEWFAYWSLIRSRRLERAASEFFPSDNAGALPGSVEVPVRRGIQRQLSLRDMLVLMLIISLVFAYGRLLHSQRVAHTKFASKLASKGGGASLTAQLPAFYAPWIPTTLKQLLPRISSVSLKSPSDVELAEVLRLEGLSQLSLSGNTYDLRLLADVSDNPYLRSIAVTDRDVDTELMSALGAAQQLQSINLLQTNTTSELLQGLGEMPALSRMNLMRTDVKLDSDEVPVWANQVQDLSLPRPEPNESITIKLRGWSALERLNCYGIDSVENSQPVKLVLRELPALTAINLDARQLYDLELSQLPRLERIERLDWRIAPSLPTNVSTSNPATPNASVPSAPWIRKLIVDNVPALKELEIYCRQLEEVQLDGSGPTTIRLTTTAELDPLSMTSTVIASQTNYIVVDGRLVDPSLETDIPVRLRQSWLDCFSQTNGPRVLDLKRFPLSGMDFEPLARNTSITSLLMSHARVAPEQLAALHSMKQLQLLDLQGIVIDGAVIEQLLAALPNLRSLKFEGSQLADLKLENHSHFESLLVDPNAYGQLARSNYVSYFQTYKLKTLHVVNMPKLADSLIVSPGVQSVRIEQAPALLGLIFGGPIPKETTLEGFRDLREFSGGGPHVTDAIATAVLTCSQLKFLTLAHAQLRHETLASIAELKQLQYLCLSGTPIDAELVVTWKALPQLRALHLEGTVVTAAMLKAIFSLRNLEELALDDLDASAVAALGELRKLRVVRLRRAEITKENLLVLAKLPIVEELDLGECHIGEEALEALAENSLPMLKLLILKAAEVPGKPLLKLAKKNEQMAIDLTNAVIDASATDALVARNRAVFFDSSDPMLGAIPFNMQNASIFARVRNGSNSAVWPGAVPAQQYGSPATSSGLR